MFWKLYQLATAVQHIYPKFSILKQQVFVFSQYLRARNSREVQLGLDPSRGFSEAVIQGCSYLKDQLQLRIYFQAHSRGCQQKPSVPHMWFFLQCCLQHSSWFEREGEGVSLGQIGSRVLIMCNRGWRTDNAMWFGSWGGNSSVPRLLPRGDSLQEAAREEMAEASSGCWKTPNGKRVVSTERLVDRQRQPDPFNIFC